MPQDPLDREICICFHVPLRKLVQHCRLTKPRRASQLSDCFNAGTGCGWCIPFLEQIFEQTQRGEPVTFKMSAEEYRARRLAYHRTGIRDLPLDDEGRPTDPLADET